MTARFKDHILGPDTHANRPAASTVPEAALYECTTHGLIYKNVSSAWVTWGSLLPPGGSTGDSLTKVSGTDYDVHWTAVSGGGSSSVKMPLDPASPTDGFTATSLDAAWSLAGSYVSGDFTFGDSWIACASGRVGNNYVYRTPPGSWTTITAKMTGLTPTAGASFGILAVDNTGAGAGVAAAYNGTPDGTIVGVLAAGVYSSGVQGSTAVPGSTVGRGFVHWLRLRKSGTSYFASSSLNGVNWSPESAAAVSAATITRIGFGAWTTAAPASFSLDWFNVA